MTGNSGRPGTIARELLLNGYAVGLFLLMLLVLVAFHFAVGDFFLGLLVDIFILRSQIIIEVV